MYSNINVQLEICFRCSGILSWSELISMLKFCFGENLVTIFYKFYLVSMTTHARFPVQTKETSRQYAILTAMMGANKGKGNREKSV